MSVERDKKKEHFYHISGDSAQSNILDDTQNYCTVRRSIPGNNIFLEKFVSAEQTCPIITMSKVFLERIE